MKEALSFLINKIFKKDLEILYGKNSYVDVCSLIYSTNKHIYVISCKLHIGDTELYQEIGETGLNYLVEESWRFMGNWNKNFMLQISFELTQ